LNQPPLDKLEARNPPQGGFLFLGLAVALPFRAAARWVVDALVLCPVDPLGFLLRALGKLDPGPRLRSPGMTRLSPIAATLRI